MTEEPNKKPGKHVEYLKLAYARTAMKYELRRTALIGRLRHCQNIDPFSIVDFVIFTIINDIYYEARKNCFACLLFEKPMHADLNDIISCLIKH